MNTVDKQLYAEYEKEGFKYPFMKNFKRWVENGCKPVVPDSYYQASEKVRSLLKSGMSTHDISEQYGVSYNVIRDLANNRYSQIGQRAVDKVLG